MALRWFRLFFGEFSCTIRNIPRFEKISKIQKLKVVMIYVILSVYYVTLMIRMLSIFSMMSVLGRTRLRQFDPMMYYFEKYFIKSDAYVLVAFILIFSPWIFSNYFVTFRIGADFQDLLVDLEGMIDCTIEWKALSRFVISGLDSIPEVISSLEFACQDLNFRSNLYASRREKAAATFIVKGLGVLIHFVLMLLKIEMILIPVMFVRYLPELMSLLVALDIGLLMIQMFKYIHCIFLAQMIGFCAGMLPCISLPASYRRFRKSLTSGVHAHMIYPAMCHHQRLFINAARQLVLLNRKLVPYSLTVHFFSNVTAITALLASITMTSQTGSAEFILLWQMIAMISFIMAMVLSFPILYSRILYYHTPLVISSNVRLARFPGMLTRKVKGNTFVEVLNIRRKIGFSLPFVGRLNTKALGSCLIVYSSLFFNFVQNYY